MEASQALALLCRSVGAGFVIDADLKKMVTVEFEQVVFEVALQAVCRQAGATYRWKDGAFWFAPVGPDIERIEFVDEPFAAAISRVFQRSDARYTITGQVRGLVSGRFIDSSRENVLEELCRQVGAKYYRKGNFFRIMPLAPRALPDAKTT